ncbi:hypothetical protein LNP00_04060 [Fructobacillus sp. M158]|uniref:hypothetical protein n=1 Tax=Fructobacillus parabroussonetiae TaxID=2713174 RepID=UPI00200ADD3D|nr:hypothetical protein [Fructobacillus parabroussonetiae]MCK8617537.1 hypothetical protein [Fructobacillus parabroussonetiae]
MINAIIVLAASTFLEAIPCFIWYKIGFKRGQKDMINKILLIVEKTKKEKDV